MILRYPRILMLILMLVLAAGLALWSVGRSTVAGQSAPADGIATLEQTIEDLEKKNAEISAHLNATPMTEPSMEKAGILEELRADLACRLPRSVCKHRRSDSELFDHLEKLEALIHLDELTDVKAAGDLLLAVLRLSPGHAAFAANLLAELPDGQALMRAMELPGLDPIAKTQVISAALDPADESLKSRLIERAHVEFERMIESGTGAEAFAATSLFRQFADLADGELARLGRSLCRFGADSSQAFLFENLKLKLRREAGAAPRLRGLMSDCKG